MDHHTPAPTFWADKQAAWVARARNFSAAEARSAVEALNKHISTAAGSLSHRKVSLSQDADGFFAWAPSSLSLLQEMGDDVRLLDDIGRTTAAASPVKGNLPPLPILSPPSRGRDYGHDPSVCGGGNDTVRLGERLLELSP